MCECDILRAPTTCWDTDVEELVRYNERKRSYYLTLVAALDKESAALRRSIA